MSNSRLVFPDISFSAICCLISAIRVSRLFRRACVGLLVAFGLTQTRAGMVAVGVVKELCSGFVNVCK